MLKHRERATRVMTRANDEMRELGAPHQLAVFRFELRRRRASLTSMPPYFVLAIPNRNKRNPQGPPPCGSRGSCLL